MPDILVNVPAAGASVSEARAGGSRVTLYTDAGATSPATLPYALSATSRRTLYVGAVGPYDVTVTDSNGRVLETASGTATAITPLVFVPAGDLAVADASGTYARRVALWATGNDYLVGELVINSGTLYRCTTAHTAGGSFAAGNFSSVGGGGGGATVTIDADGSLVVDGTTVELGTDAEIAAAIAAAAATKITAPATPVGGQLLTYNAATSQWESQPSPSTPTNLSPLQRFRLALGGADFTPVNILMIGDSVTEGTGAGCTAITDNATTVFTNFAVNRYPYRFVKLLRQRHTRTGAGGDGWVPLCGGSVAGVDGAWRSSANGGAYWTLVNTAGQVSTNFLNGKNQDFTNGSSPSATLNFTGTGLDIVTYAAGAPSNYAYTIDGGAAVQVTNPTGGIRKITAQVRGLSAGPHTLVITPGSGATNIFPQGCYVYNGDENSGIRLWDSGTFGAVSSGGSLSNFQSYIPSAFTPQLVTIFFGLNDFKQNVNPATMKSNVEQMIANIKTACGAGATPSFLLITPFERGDHPSPTYPWSQYVAAYSQVAAADPTNVAAISFADRMPKPVSGNGGAYGLVVNDWVHPTAQGHNFMAQAMAELVSPA